MKNSRVLNGLSHCGSPLRSLSLLASLALLVCLFSAQPLFAESVKSLILPLDTSSSGSSLNGGTGSSPSTMSVGATLESEDPDAISRALKKAIAEEPKAPFSTSVAPNSLITQEIRYEMPAAGEVYLGWGINGWHEVPERLRPSGTTVHNGTRSTLMKHEGNTF